MWNKIKKILSKQGDKCIIVEENQPTYVVMKLEDYEKLSDNSQVSEVEKANRDVAEWKAEEKTEEQVSEPAHQEESKEEVKVEDLPF